MDRKQRDYWVWVGSSFASNDYDDSGDIGNTTSYTFTGYPSDGSTVYVSIYYRPASGGVWLRTTFTYSAPTLSCSAAIMATTAILQNECDTLLAFYDSTDGDNWNDNSGWNTVSDPCSWFGVNCSGTNVTVLSLSGNGLMGEIPDLSNLQNLSTLSLGNNQLAGEIPDVSNSQNLSDLGLWNNQLTGEIPELSSSTEHQLV